MEMKFIRENPGIVKEDLRKRGDLDKIAWVDKLLELDSQWRELVTQINKLRERRNQLTALISKLKREGKDPVNEMKEAEEIPSRIRELEGDLESIKSAMIELDRNLREIVKKGQWERAENLI